MLQPSPSVGIAVITHNAAQLLPRSLPPLQAFAERPRLVVVNSSSRDGTVDLAQRLGAETLVVERSHFNHGATRELARKFLGTDIVVMMTPDAIPAHPDMLTRLLRPLVSGEADVAYARQIPHPGAGFLESFPRQFNYPDVGHVRTAQDHDQYGAYLYFCSNSCAAWLNSTLDRIGGFRPALTQEDANAAVRLLASGGRIAYVADAVVFHSHKYGLKQEFKRYFDVGYERRWGAERVFAAAADESRGRDYSRIMLGQLWKSQPWALPYGLLVLAAKYLGYKVGENGAHLHHGLIRKLSAQDFYWDSIYANPSPPEV